MRILSGTRPTGKLHLGNYFGAIKRYIELQESGADCFFCIVDWHTLTTDYADPSQLQNNVREVLLDWLACGIDPKNRRFSCSHRLKSTLNCSFYCR
jgi:tryptophanyl-tRNA synthetase